MTNCFRHIDKEAIAECTICNNPICTACHIKILKMDYCEDCAEELIEKGIAALLQKVYEYSPEKRIYQRINVLAGVDINTRNSEEVVFNGVLINISSMGAAVVVDKELDIKTQVFLDFQIQGEEKFENIQGSIVRAEKLSDRYYCFGVTFMNLGNDQIKLNRFIFNQNRKKYLKDQEKIGFV
ncbi:MAG: PilZ domain-containing protein [Candidatus Firestonebacteria bacterium]